MECVAIMIHFSASFSPEPLAASLTTTADRDARLQVLKCWRVVVVAKLLIHWSLLHTCHPSCLVRSCCYWSMLVTIARRRFSEVAARHKFWLNKLMHLYMLLLQFQAHRVVLRLNMCNTRNEQGQATPNFADTICLFVNKAATAFDSFTDTTSFSGRLPSSQHLTRTTGYKSLQHHIVSVYSHQANKHIVLRKFLAHTIIIEIILCVLYSSYSTG